MINLMLSSRDLNCLTYLTKLQSPILRYQVHLRKSSFLKNVMLQFYALSCIQLYKLSEIISEK